MQETKVGDTIKLIQLAKDKNKIDLVWNK